MSKEDELRGLMQASLSGDAAAHRAMLQALSGCLRAYYKTRLSRMGRGLAEAEDMVQEALMAIHCRRHTYDVAQPLLPWVYAIARYKLIDHLRATRNSKAEVPIENGNEVFAADDHAPAESAIDLVKLLSGLPTRMHSAIQSVKLDGLSITEAAIRHGTSESAIKTNVHRGLRALAVSVRREREHENR